MRRLDKVLTAAAILAIPLLLFNGWKTIRAGVDAVHRWNEERSISALTDSLRISYDGNAVFGNPDGESTIFEFIDYQCPGCRTADSILHASLRKDGDIRLVALQYPLSKIHPLAQTAAEASICAQQHAWFHEFHHTLFKLGVPETRDRLWAIAASAGATDSVQFLSCLDDPRTKEAVQHERELGDRLGVRGTPTFITPEGTQAGLDYVVTLMQESSSVEE